MTTSHQRERTRQNYDYISRPWSDCQRNSAPWVPGKMGSEDLGAQLIRLLGREKAPAVMAGALEAPQSPRRPLGRDQISE